MAYGLVTKFTGHLLRAQELMELKLCTKPLLNKYPSQQEFLGILQISIILRLQCIISAVRRGERI
jgi:hypothetical protein